MSDILSEYGPDSAMKQEPRASGGAHMPVKEIPYSPPVGPANQYHQGPGLADHTNHGNCGTQGKH